MLRQLWAVGLMCFGVAGVPALAETLPRVAAVDHCASHYLMTLADREQIASVTKSAATARWSYVATRIAEGQILVNRRTVEEMIEQKPDLVLIGPRNRSKKVLLQQAGLTYLQVDEVKSLAELDKMIEKISIALGQEQRGAAMRRAIVVARAQALEKQGERKPLAAIIGANGYTRGEKTLLDDLLHAGGMRNAVAESGRKGALRLSLEELVMLQPDIIIRDSRDSMDWGPRLGLQFLLHPALRRAVPDLQHVTMPGKYWSCPGEITPEAIASLSQAALEWREGTLKP